jgi:hypothetical protein
VRALYDQMALITIEPDWAKLLDFETTIPKAVEDLVQHARARPSSTDSSPFAIRMCGRGTEEATMTRYMSPAADSSAR